MSEENYLLTKEYGIMKLRNVLAIDCAITILKEIRNSLLKEKSK